MSSRTQQLRQSFLLMGAVVALVLVAGFALFSSRSVTRIVERQANERGQDMGTHVASLVGMYLRERRREAEALARSPAVVRAALDGSQQAISRRLPQLDTPTLERMFNQRHVLGGDPELAAYFRDYVQRSEFSELFFTESHGYSVLASNRTSDFVQSDEEWWRQAVADGLYEGAPRYDSSAAAVSLEYDVAIRAPRVSAPVGVLKAVFPLDRLSQLLTAADAGAGGRLQVVDAQGTLIVGGAGGGGKPNQADLLHPIPDAAAVPRRERPDTATVPGTSGEDLVVTVPVDNGKWWVVFRQPKATAYAAARTTAASIVIWTVVLFGATLALLFAFWRRLNKRVTEPVKAAGAIASRVAGGDLSVTVVTERSGTAEVGDLLTSVHSMVVALRRPLGGGRGGGDGHGNLGLHRADERVDRGDVRHLPGPDQAGGGAGPAGARRGGRCDQDPPDRDHPRRGCRGLGATQQRRRRRRPAQQGRVGSEYGATRDAGRRGEPRCRRGRSAGAGLSRHPKVRDAGQGGGHADEHAGPERGDRSGARRAAGTRLRRRGGRGAEARLGGGGRGGRHRRHGARGAHPRAGDARPADTARPGYRHRTGRSPDGGPGPRDRGR